MTYPFAPPLPLDASPAPRPLGRRPVVVNHLGHGIADLLSTHPTAPDPDRPWLVPAGAAYAAGLTPSDLVDPLARY